MAKIAVKRGIQNTNNKLMAEEIKVCFCAYLVQPLMTYFPNNN